MEHGTVKSFDENRGFGFIVLDDGTEVFVHYSAIEGEGFRVLKAGDQVSLMVVQGAKGLQAVKVSVIDDQNSSETPIINADKHEN
ncbi:hypothetical protein IV80_GL000373 [Pediococcus cellicola]|uniref:CSD domain-containing protein n=1 Tax=Pediococcus cellicola TaxID=319652 RepID=A0A0R2ITN7_9LACO|nr:cold shock domain-containing protein [Pediococcus cellicola]KRN65319.1 hypothetical protein IV80_GL000373 [Pediococcus cellicola]GEL15772.1 cold-shock protein [Pediococcus cellicola]